VDVQGRPVTGQPILVGGGILQTAEEGDALMTVADEMGDGGLKSAERIGTDEIQPLDLPGQDHDRQRQFFDPFQNLLGCIVDGIRIIPRTLFSSIESIWRSCFTLELKLIPNVIV